MSDQVDTVDPVDVDFEEGQDVEHDDPTQDEQDIFNTEDVYFYPVRKIGGFVATVTVSETHTDTIEVTRHPVQQGAAITDHAYVKPCTLSIKASFGFGETPLEELYNQLLNMQSSRQPFDIVTGKRAYSNMLCTSLSVTTDSKTENVLSISAEFTQVILTQLEIVTVPKRAQQKKPGKTGATENEGKKSAQEADKPKKQSVLKSAAKIF
jgi:hypothetical protein